MTTAQTGAFIFESLYEGLNTVIEYCDSVAGIQITSGVISSVNILASPLIQGLTIDYQISFMPYNSIGLGGGIKIVFPSTFQNLDVYCRVLSGLKTIDVSNPISCVSDGLTLKVTNFNDYQPQEVKIACNARNPPFPGETSHFRIFTYSDTTWKDAKVIDRNENAGTVFISSIEIPEHAEVEFYKPTASSLYMAKTPLDIEIFPQLGKFLPPSTTASSYGMIVVQFPIWYTE